MLYDNALLVPAYLDAFLATGNELFARIARECCDWVLREMTTRKAASRARRTPTARAKRASSSPWTPRELGAVLGAKTGSVGGGVVRRERRGNFEHGTSALWRHEPAEKVAQGLHVDVRDARGDDVRRAREALRRARAARSSRHRRQGPRQLERV
jgi:uncharacterized protein YyaL (SSP411 family)